MSLRAIVVAALALLWTGAMHAQIKWEHITGSPYSIGTTAPATCTIGDVFFKTNATAGRNMYLCTSSNTWTQQTFAVEAHASNHAAAGSDPVTLSQSQITNLTTDLSGKEPTITAGTTGQYWRGDKSWQTLNSAAVGLGNVENTALSTWAGSGNITTVGTLASGGLPWSLVTGAPSTYDPTAHAASHAAAGADPLTLSSSQVGLGNVENTALSTWAGSSNITTLGIVASGEVPWALLTGVPSEYTPSSHSHAASDITSGELPLARGGTGNSSFVASRCVQVSADGTRLESADAACGTGSSSANPPYAIAFSAETTKTVTAATHGLGTTPLYGGCFDDTNGELVRHKTWVRNGSGDTTITFDAAFTGVCYIHAGSGYEGGGGGDVASVFGRTGAVTATSGDYSFSLISGTAAVNQGGTGATTAAGARASLLPSMSGNSGKCMAVNTGETDVEYVACGDVTPLYTAFTTSSFPSVSAGGYACVSFTLTGMVSSDFYSVGLPSTIEAGLSPYVISGSDGGSFCFTNHTGSPISPANGQQIRIMVLRPTI